MPRNNYHSKSMKVNSPKTMKSVNSKAKPSDGDWNAAKANRKAFNEQKQFQKAKQIQKPKVSIPKLTNRL